MLRRGLAALVVMVAVGGIVMAEDVTGRIVSIEDGMITLSVGGGRGKDKGKAEEKKFKVSKDTKISKAAPKDKDKEDAVKLTLDELKTAVKVTTVFVTATVDGDNVTEIKTGFGFGGGNFGKDKGKDKKKDDQ